jgi:ketosteroid isomerase-like protein
MFRRNTSLGVGLAVVALTAGVALAADSSRSTEETINHHMQSISSGNVDAIMGDYAENAVLIDGNGVAKGKAAIRKLFERMFAGGQVGGMGAGPTPPDKRIFEGEIAYIAWTPKGSAPPAGPGAETYVVRKGLIEAQVVTSAAPPR